MSFDVLDQDSLAGRVAEHRMNPDPELLVRLGFRRRMDRRCLAVVATTQDIIGLGRQAVVSHLTAAEIGRGEALQSIAARDAFIASHVLARYVASALAGVDVARLILVQRCDICGGPHGAAFFRDHPNLRVSLSHSAGIVAAAAADAPVGIDVETWDHARCFEELQHCGAFGPNEVRLLAARPRQRDGPSAISRFEADALQLWLRKECLVKLGRLSLDSLGSCDLSYLPLPAAWHASTSPVAYGALQFTDWSEPQHRVSGAVVSSHPAEIVFFDGVRRT